MSAIGLNVRPHVAQNLARSRGRSAIDGRTTRHLGYAASQRIRKRIEEGFGWIKQIAGLARPKLRGRPKLDWSFTFAAARLQSRAAAQAHGENNVREPRDCRVIGRWRIVEADLWDAEYLDLVAPATLIIGGDGRGEIAFGAFQAGLDLSYGKTIAFFTWSGFDEMDEVNGDGSADLLDDGTLEIEINRHLGDEAVLKAIPVPSSTAC